MLTSVHGHYVVHHMLRMKSLLRKMTFVFKMRVWMFTHTGVKSSNQGQCFHLRLAQATDHRHDCLLLNFRSAWKCLVPNLVCGLSFIGTL